MKLTMSDLQNGNFIQFHLTRANAYLDSYFLFLTQKVAYYTYYSELCLSAVSALEIFPYLPQ